MDRSVDRSDDHPINDDQVEARLSTSLLRLNFQDRNEITEEVHGVRSLGREETPELINDSLHKMNAELLSLVSEPQNHQCAFQRAQHLQKTFVNDRNFRLKFLRVELFDPIKAADRMMLCLDYLLYLFGQRGLEEPLDSSFFVKEEAAALREGYIQLLPFRDRRGRRILVLLTKAFSYDPKLRVKLCFYFCHALSEDVETQRRGIVWIVWGRPDMDKILKFPGTPGNKRIVLPNGGECNNAAQIRVVAIHMCLPPTPFFRLVKSFYVLIIHDTHLQRMVFHHGTQTEMRYKLMGFGIPVSLLPDTDTGVVKVKNHIQWLKIRKQLEGDPIAQANICECPGLNDVLFRRAGTCLTHPGNFLFKNLLESIKDEHNNSTQSEKRDISWSIVKDIESRNGRFFKWCTNTTCWIRITDRSEIRLKVAMSIRDFNRHARAVQNSQSTKSSTNAFCNENKRKRKNPENTDCTRRAIY